MNNSNDTRIPLNLSGTEGVRYETCPLTFGVPFADEALEKGTTVRIVDETGQPLPVQTQCLTTWNGDQKYVKWLLVDLQTDLSGDGDRPLFLEYPAKDNPPEPEHTICIEETETTLCVDTGVMRLSFRRTFDVWRQPRNPDVFAGCQVKTEDGWHDIFRGHPGPFLYMKDQAGNTYDSCSAGPAPQIVIEEAGPLRACVRIQGYHATAQGHRFCPYTLRIHLFAGKSDLRICHTFVYDQDPHAIELAAIGMDLPLDLGEDLRAAVGGENGVHRAANWQEMQVLQSDDLHYSVDLDGDRYDSGEKAPGWVSLNGSRGGTIAVIHNFWQEYPAGFALNPNGIDIQIWPETHPENLVFSTPFEEPAIQFTGPDGQSLRDEEAVRRLIEENPTAPLGLRSFNIRSVDDAAWVEQMIEKYAQSRAITYNDISTNNGIGAAKTTEIFIRFSGSALTDAEANMLAENVQEPLVAVVDPAYVGATQALGHVHPAGDARFAGVDTNLEDVFEITAIDPVTRCRRYGKMRYGNMVCAHSPASGWVYLLYKDSDPEKALRYIGTYNNEAVDQIMAVWSHFVRTGNREHLLIARQYARCVADVAFVHAHPEHPEHVGVIHYHNGHLWSGQMSTSHSIITGILTDYYMTGNRRLLDVAREAADRVVSTQEPAGILSVRQGGLHRNFTGPLSILLDVYQATWEEQYGELARRSLNWMLRTVPEPGRLPNAIFTGGDRGDEAAVHPACLPEVAWGNKYDLYESALRLINSRTLREFLITEADYWVWKSPKNMLNYQCTTVCFAYDLTGDITYAAYSKHVIEALFHDFAEGMRTGRQMDFQALWFSGFIPRLMKTVADAMDRDPERFAAAAEAWWDERQQQPDRESEERPDRGPKTVLGKLSAEPHPKS